MSPLPSIDPDPVHVREGLKKKTRSRGLEQGSPSGFEALKKRPTPPLGWDGPYFTLEGSLESKWKVTKAYRTHGRWELQEKRGVRCLDPSRDGVQTGSDTGLSPTEPRPSLVLAETSGNAGCMLSGAMACKLG
jgi:hypothetical protein